MKRVQFGSFTGDSGAFAGLYHVPFFEDRYPILAGLDAGGNEDPFFVCFY